MRVQRQGVWLSAAIGSDSVMMNVASGDFVTLSKVGARIWELLAEPMLVADLCARLASEFDVSPETCRAEVDAFLADLARHGAVSLSQ